MADRTVAYVLKGYPRVSELFIASEIWRLEQAGVPLRLFVLKPADESTHHPVVDRIAATPDRLPPTTSLSAQPLLPWLRRNAGPFLPSIGPVARRHPLRFVGVLGAVAAQSVRARKGWWPRKIYVKELLQAIVLADRVQRAGDVAHLHAHFAHGTTTVTWLAARLTALPFSFTGHAKDVYRPALNPAGLLVRKLRAAAFVVTCTGANKAHLEGLAPGTDVHLVYHGLNADFVRLLPDAEPRVRPERFRVVSVGRLVRKKGFDVLVEAIGRLHERSVDVELVIAGESGDQERAVRDLVSARGLDRSVTFLGPVSQARLLSEYRRASVFALACRVDGDGDRDGIPNVMVEAMAAGLPVVSTAVSGIPELVEDGRTGLLVPPDDAEALADAVWRLAKDPSLAARLAGAGRVTVAERFDGDALTQTLVDLFTRARR
jgi:glycosyltransferase involved in cell wall biosynthesis